MILILNRSRKVEVEDEILTLLKTPVKRVLRKNGRQGKREERRREV